VLGGVSVEVLEQLLEPTAVGSDSLRRVDVDVERLVETNGGRSES
jgi:hypothetical protein